MTSEMSRKPVVLMACGSFNPPTPMHFRMFEIAKDHFHNLNTVSILGGIVSPVNDEYAKKDLIAGNHRYAMVQSALKSSNWIKVSDWEINRDGWTKTRYCLQYHQNYINAYLQASLNGNFEDKPPSWMPDEIINLARNSTTGVDETDGVMINNRINNGNEGEGNLREKIQVRLLCGGDLLESFAVPGLWEAEDLEAILGEHGLVVITRNGSNPEKFIYESDILSQYKRNITLITNWVPNEVSSTMIRRLVRRGESVKYLIDDSIISYIKSHRLYGYDSQSTKYLPVFNSQSCLTTPSPNDIVMRPPSEFRNQKDNNNIPYKQRNVTISSKIINYLIGVDEIDKNDVYTSSTQSVSNHVKEKRSRLTNKVSASGELPPKSFCGDDQNSIDSLESMHVLPRKSVKVITDVSGVHKIVNSKKKVRGNSLDITDDVFVFINSKMVSDDVFKSEIERLKIGDELDGNGAESVDSPRSPLRSYDEIVKFIFSEHGIQVISDRETIV